MIRTKSHIIIVIIAISICACTTHRLTCPAFQSAFIHDQTTLDQHFSYFGRDSMPKIMEASKDKRLLIDPVTYKRKLGSLQTIPMVDIYPQEEDSATFNDDLSEELLYVDEDVRQRDMYNEEDLLREMEPEEPSNDAPDAVADDSTYVISLKKEKFNVDQELYLWYMKDFLVYPDVKIILSQLENPPQEEEPKEEKVGFFKRLFGGKKNELDSASMDSLGMEDNKKKGLFSFLRKKKNKQDTVEVENIPQVDEDGFYNDGGTEDNYLNEDGDGQPEVDSSAIEEEQSTTAEDAETVGVEEFDEPEDTSVKKKRKDKKAKKKEKKAKKKNKGSDETVEPPSAEGETVVEEQSTKKKKKEKKNKKAKKAKKDEGAVASPPTADDTGSSEDEKPKKKKKEKKNKKVKKGKNEEVSPQSTEADVGVSDDKKAKKAKKAKKKKEKKSKKKSATNDQSPVESGDDVDKEKVNKKKDKPKKKKKEKKAKAKSEEVVNAPPQKEESGKGEKQDQSDKQKKQKKQKKEKVKKPKKEKEEKPPKEKKEKKPKEKKEKKPKEKKKKSSKEEKSDDDGKS